MIELIERILDNIIRIMWVILLYKWIIENYHIPFIPFTGG